VDFLDDGVFDSYDLLHSWQDNPTDTKWMSVFVYSQNFYRYIAVFRPSPPGTGRVELEIAEIEIY